MKNIKVISLLIFFAVIVFALLDSNSSLNDEIKSIKREVSSRLSNSNKMASLISQMPALAGAIEFQSYRQLDVVIENMFKDDSSLKGVVVADHEGAILHSKSSSLEDFSSPSGSIMQFASGYSYHFVGGYLFISKKISSDFSTQVFYIIFQFDYLSLFNDRFQLLSLPALLVNDQNYHLKKLDLEFIKIEHFNLWLSYLKSYFKKNVFRLSAIVLTLLLLATFLVRLLVSPIQEIVFSLKNIFNDNHSIPNKESYPKIFRPIIKNIIDANLAIKDASRKQIEGDILKERNEAVSKTAAKVAHDIRSPLTSLEYIVKNISPILAEKERITANQALDRISDILRTLDGKKTSEDSKEVKVEIIDPLVKRILSEKRLEFKHKTYIELRLFNNIPYGTFVKISKADFYRTMSNLINNSAEAFVANQKLSIDIILSAHEGQCQIVIRDNGKGIPGDQISRVLQHGVSFGKESGSGIGLSSAQETIQRYNGTLSLQSEEGKGTVVSITLPFGAAPKWFETSLVLRSKNVCIVDDDDSIHSIWDEILSGKNISVTHIKSSDEFEQWISEADFSIFSFLFDLELLGSKMNGLEIIEKYNLESRSSLVTSHYDDLSVQQKAQELAIKIIPKDSASSIPIALVIDSPLKMVLIDDDNLVHAIWKLSADKKNIEIFSYFSIDDFIKDSQKFSKDTMIFIDSNLNDGVKGEIESKKIYDHGFANLTLASATDFPELPFWIKGQQSKAFPVI